MDDLDLVVGRGEIVALLGPNGAGKTTTAEIIEGYRSPDGGSVRVLGLDPRADAPRLKPRLGLMLQGGELYNLVTVREAVELFAAFYPSPLHPTHVLEQVGLAVLADRRYRTLSGGERQRLSLALALVGRPTVAILDEPTGAMDAGARRNTWELLRTLRSGGAAILITTHLLDEAELLADRVAIIDAGRLVAVGSPAELRSGARGSGPARPGDAGLREVRVELAQALDPAHEAGLRRLKGVLRLRSDRSGLYVVTTESTGELLVELATWLWASGLEPESIDLRGASLEDVFLRLTGESVRSPGPGSPSP